MNKDYKIFSPLIIILAIILIGTIGFMLIEGYSFFDGLYMTVITVTTVGYAEIHTLSTAGRIFNILLICSGFATFAYALAKFTQNVLDGELNKYFKNRKMMNAISTLENHVIICGYGRNGRQACDTLLHHNETFLVIEKSEGQISSHHSYKNNSILYIQGDATTDEVLIKAGIQKAKALISALPDDADNVFIVLSARSLNDTIQIISRASNPGSVAKLKKAGANNVIMPDKIGGTHMATLVSKPDVMEFIDFLSGEEGDPIHLDSIHYEVLPRHLKDKTIEEIMGFYKSNINCIGIKNEDGKFIINPPDKTLITRGMKLIVLGTKEQIKRAKSEY